MSKPFDLAAAQAGEPVEALCYTDYPPDSTWKPCHFVGISKQGFPVVQRSDRNKLHEVAEGGLRMAPKKVTVRYRNFKGRYDNGKSFVGILNDDGGDWLERINNCSFFVEWIHTDWQTAEVPQ